MTNPDLPTASITAADAAHLFRQVSGGGNGYLSLAAVGPTRFNPPPTIEDAQHVTADRILPAYCDETLDVAITVLFGAGTGTGTHGMSLILVSPEDKVEVVFHPHIG